MMSTLRTAAIRTTYRLASRPRPLSTETSMAVQKLRSVLEEYRAQNYTQELPTRFKKEICQAAVQSPKSDIVVEDGMWKVLNNIGAGSRLTPAEMHVIFEEIGNGKGQIPVERMKQMI